MFSPVLNARSHEGTGTQFPQSQCDDYWDISTGQVTVLHFCQPLTPPVMSDTYKLNFLFPLELAARKAMGVQEISSTNV